MKTYPSYDVDLCDNEECRKKMSCKRYLTYLMAMEENYPYPLWIIIPKYPCDAYDEIKED